MPLQSAILAGNPRLEQAATTGPSVKQGPPHDDPSAVAAIQRALVALGFPLPRSFAGGQADGIFGPETFRAVYSFQRQEFPSSPSEWDGRCGPKTLARMDSRLPRAETIDPPIVLPPGIVRTVSVCSITAPAAEPTPAAADTGRPRPGGVRGIRRA
jgi:peptidoglycan hydrolase-like protein with peptidoglycan-binding domain